MINQQFHRAIEISERVGNFPVHSNEQGIADTLNGIQLTCRPLSGVLRNEFEESDLGLLEPQNRQTIVHAYSNLMLASDAVRAEARLMPPSLMFTYGSGDTLQMAHAGIFAQYTADTIAGRIDMFGDRVDPQSVAVMALTAVRAVIAWSPYQYVFTGHNEGYYTGNFQEGLAKIDRALAPGE